MTEVVTSLALLILVRILFFVANRDYVHPVHPKYSKKSAFPFYSFDVKSGFSYHLAWWHKRHVIHAVKLNELNKLTNVGGNNNFSSLWSDACWPSSGILQTPPIACFWQLGWALRQVGSENTEKCLWTVCMRLARLAQQAICMIWVIAELSI